jgi:type III pantothenate kinase
MQDSDLKILAVNIGNSRVSAAIVAGADVGAISDAPANDPRAAADMIVELAHGLEDAARAAIILASVNMEASTQIAGMLEGRTPCGVYRVGSDLVIPQAHTLGPNHTTGQDRLLNALAAYQAVNQACVVVDAGTAVTVDFVDGEGVFHGGAIAPGARMQLRSLHEQTSALPDVELAWPDDSEAFAKTTPQAMLQGVCIGIRGMVRALLERYAERYGAYPQVVATGGDASLLFGSDELIDNIVPDLTLRGIAAAAQAALAEADAAAE